VASASPSPLAAALARVGDRWSLLIVDALLAGPRRFNELLDAIPGRASNVLTQRLRQLEQEQVVLARPYQERPTRFSYELTASGGELAGALRLLAGWGDEALGPRHAACGSPLEVRWHCPACDRPIEDPDTDGLEYA
jgi:DNA-binding HxlR family transcriptional regulator